MQPRQVSKDTRSKIVELYISGERIATLGKQWGYDYKTVRRILVEEGIAIKQCGGKRLPSVATIETVVGWINSGESCNQIAKRFGTYANKIATLLRESGIEPPDGRIRRGSANPITKTGRWLNNTGYVTVTLEPNEYALRGTRDGTNMLEHRLVMAKCLERPLLKSETVHHKNGDKTDNRLVKGHEFKCPGDCCNLELWSTEQPPGQRVTDKIRYAKEILARYDS